MFPPQSIHHRHQQHPKYHQLCFSSSSRFRKQHRSMRVGAPMQMATVQSAAVIRLQLRQQHSSFTPPTPRLPLGRKIGRPSLVARSRQRVESKAAASFTEEENSLIDALIGIQGRGCSVSPSQLHEVESAVQKLEGLTGVSDTTGSSLIEGRWQLMFTTRPATASPIQRTFVGVDSFSVFQEIYLSTDDPRVSNIVKFSDTIGELKVEAIASAKDGKRILCQFDRAAFSFKFLPFKVPYPVLFRLLGDEAKGWLDTTYLSQSGNIRISRGNKCREQRLCCKKKLKKDRD